MNLESPHIIKVKIRFSNVNSHFVHAGLGHQRIVARSAVESSSALLLKYYGRKQLLNIFVGKTLCIMYLGKCRIGNVITIMSRVFGLLMSSQ